ncbi:MAG TPA: single-stranded DNA-binding protein [Flavobacteriales bacterium]|nr:single-stranded DNA-binding protein [Methylococcaceae bacterium]HHZ96639.1 single-stranded DNA-binding protein [Flavobacteriales bacterium]
MEKSESIKNIAVAMCKAQGEMGGAHKGANNPFFKSKYADLGSVVEAVKEPFATNGLSYVQFPINDGDRIGVETILMHESGEWLSDRFTVKATKQDAQGAGSVITYCRRYGLQAVAGIPSEDDDGHAASKSSNAPAKPSNDDMSWINAIKGDSKVIEQITDPVYKTRIQLFIKEGY